VSELRFLGALQVELLRHGELGHDHPAHEALQVSTLQALLGGASMAMSRWTSCSSTAIWDWER